VVIERIADELARREPKRAERGSYDVQAAVALLLRPADDKLEFLAIKRAEDERDPWSGHIALPGGRRDLEDESLWATAVRETREEVGVDLAGSGRLLGQLDDVWPRTRRIPAIAITPFVVGVDAGTQARTNSEVEYAVWVPLEIVTDERLRGTLTLDAVPDREFPTIEYGGHVIWGLTLGILRQFEEILNRVGYAERGAG
jgi:8-oxo-dGTP pyrophosphatase MutT (NUDIX family)